MNLLFLGGGLWLVLVLMFIIGAWLVYQAWAASKSNSTVTKGGVTTDNTGNVPMHKQGKFWMGVIVWALMIGAFLLMRADR